MGALTIFFDEDSLGAPAALSAGAGSATLGSFGDVAARLLTMLFDIHHRFLVIAPWVTSAGMISDNVPHHMGSFKCLLALRRMFSVQLLL